MASAVGLERSMRKKLPDESGMTLVEAMIAMLVLLVGLLAVAQVIVFSTLAGKAYGRDATQATAAAHDKMEELTGLAFTDTTTNITVAPPFPANGVGLTAGGSIPPAAPAAGYCDYLDPAGVRTTAGAAAYTRQWLSEIRTYGGVNKLPPTPAQVAAWSSQ